LLDHTTTTNTPYDSRQLKLIEQSTKMPPAPTIPQIQSLYNATLTTAARFGSYNFHSFFTYRTHQTFKPILSALDPEPGSTPMSQPDPNMLAKFYETKTAELEVLKRSAEINRMYAGQKLVVEHARPITAGGGDGAEASP
jgi:hypothetical protein